MCAPSPMGPYLKGVTPHPVMRADFSLWERRSTQLASRARGLFISWRAKHYRQPEPRSNSLVRAI
jgi:hypothetical protein